jgi:hypothetical protein
MLRDAIGGLQIRLKPGLVGLVVSIRPEVHGATQPPGFGLRP